MTAPRRHEPDGAAPAHVTPLAGGLTRQDLFSVLGALGAILTLFTAVMFYFGLRRSDVQSRAMHIDVSLFGFSTQDYVLRSVSALYLPFLVLIGLALAALWGHRQVVRLLSAPSLSEADRRSRARTWTGRLSGVAAAVAVGALAFTVAAGMPAPAAPVAWLAGLLQDRQWVVPLVLVVATLAAAYLAWVRRQLDPDPEAGGSRAGRTLLPVLVAGTVVLGGFWLLEEYASAVGRGHVRQLASQVDALARTVVISPSPLGLEVPGVVEERQGDPDSPDVLYRTSGLRLLARSDTKVLLVPEGWTPANGVVIVLADSPELTWEFSR